MVAAVACARGSQPVVVESSFSEAASRLLDRIDCRHADTDEEREAIFRLRYQAYLRDGSILPNPSESFSDPFDETDNVYIFGLYIDNELASSIRIHIGSRQHPHFPSLEVFPDVLQPKLDAGKVIVDATRFVVDEKLSKLYRALPYATVRINWMAAAFFDPGYSLAAVRPEHQAFYRRTFGLELICGARPYPHLIKPICLMASDYRTVADYVHRRYPFFRSTFFERRALFERNAPMLQATCEPTRVQGGVAPFVELGTARLAG